MCYSGRSEKMKHQVWVARWSLEQSCGQRCLQVCKQLKSTDMIQIVSLPLVIAVLPCWVTSAKLQRIQIILMLETKKIRDLNILIPRKARLFLKADRAYAYFRFLLQATCKSQLGPSRAGVPAGISHLVARIFIYPVSFWRSQASS